jgi:hypothetical protein
MTEFNPDLQADPGDIPIDFDVSRIEPSDAHPASPPEGSTGDPAGAPCSTRATLQREATPPLRTRTWLFRGLGVLGSLTLTLGVVGLSSFGKHESLIREPAPVKAGARNPPTSSLQPCAAPTAAASPKAPATGPSALRAQAPCSRPSSPAIY